jgi:hypothetical protein
MPRFRNAPSRRRQPAPTAKWETPDEQVKFALQTSRPGSAYDAPGHGTEEDDFDAGQEYSSRSLRVRLRAKTLLNHAQSSTHKGRSRASLFGSSPATTAASNRRRAVHG